MTVGDGTANSHSRAERVMFYLLLVWLLAAPLVITTYVGVEEVKWAVIRIGGPALLAAWLAHRILSGGLRLRVDGITVLAFALVAIQAASAINAINPASVATVVSKQLGLLSAFLLVVNLMATKADRDRLLWTVALLGGAASAYGIAQHWGYDFFPWQEHSEVPVSRGVSFFGHATFAGSLLTLTIPLTIGLLATREGLAARLLPALFVGLMLYHLSFSGARIATIGLLIAALAAAGVWFFEGTFKGRVKLIGSVTVRRTTLAAAILAVVAVMGAAFLVRAWIVKDSDLLAIRQSSLAQRLYTWETASRMFLDRPLTGVGAGNYAAAAPGYWNAVESNSFARNERRAYEAHNEYLEAAAEMGLPGVIVVLGLTAFGMSGALALWRRAADWQARRLGLALFAAILAVSVDASITYTFQAPASGLMYWVVLGLISNALWREPRGARSYAIEGAS